MNDLFESLYDLYYKQYSDTFIFEMTRIVRHQNSEFIRYSESPKSYVLSIYDPLKFSYVVLGKENYWIKLGFIENLEHDHVLETYAKVNNLEILSVERSIECLFLNRCLNQIISSENLKLDFFLNQHAVDISFDIMKLKSKNSDELWENLEMD